MASDNQQPVARAWYQEPWMWFIVGMPLAWVCLSLFGVYLTVSNKDDLVRDDWYHAGRTINEDLRADERARAIGLVGTLSFDPASRQVKVLLNLAVPAPELKLEVVHATIAREDMVVLLQPSGAGIYTGVLPDEPAGKRNLMLLPQGEGIDHESRWRLRASEVFFLGHDIALTPNG